MRRVLYEVTRFAPFLRSERGALQIQRAVAAASGDPVKDTDDVDAHGATVEGRDLTGLSLGRWNATGATLRGFKGDSITWQVMNADRATVSDWELPGAHLALVSLHGALLDGVSLDGAQCVLCDFSRATLRAVSLRGARLDGCDFTGAVFESVDLTGADLRGTVLRGAWLAGATLEGARVAGADLRDVAGLSASQRADLSSRGARVSGSWLYRLWGRVLGGGDPPLPSAHARLRAAVTWTWAVAMALLPALFFLRAALNPINPDEPPFWEGSYEEPEEPPQD
ncbi:MAG: pentapeptide repeat-containing protein [Deltaproteobacteria bacterium]|nr:pentapeptide repeat-containing protein [Deltaproteobacteria bacterium]